MRKLPAGALLAVTLLGVGAASAQTMPSMDPPGPMPPPAAPALEPTRPPPLNVEYAQLGVAISSMFNMSSGATCGSSVKVPAGALDPKAAAPCILGSGGGLVVRAGYRAPGPWYIGGAYEFTKMDSSNLFRLGIFQQIRAEMRWMPYTGYRARPYFTAGLGGVAYGNEWGVETGGGMLFAGGGIEFEVTREALVGLGGAYRPVLLAAWTDTAGIARPLGLSQFLGIELRLEVRTETGRR